MEAKKSFIIHIDALDVLEELNSDQVKELFIALRDYNLGKEITLTGLMKAIFIPFKNQFDRDAEKYKKIVERNRANGLKGGRPESQKNPAEPKKPNGLNGNPTEPKKADSDSDNDSDNDLLLKKEAKGDFLPDDYSISDIDKKNEIAEAKKVAQKKVEFILPFPTKDFKDQWTEWKLYRKKKHKYTFFDDKAEQKKLTEIFNLSKENEKTALLIIRQSIDNGWKGFFELKQTNNGTTNNRTANGGKITASQYFANEFDREASADSKGEDNTIDVEAIIV